MAIVGRAAPLSLLVIRLSAMGDVAMTVPVLALLRRQYPEIKITVLTTKFLQPFFREVADVSFFAPDLKGRHKGVKGIWTMSRDLGRFDLVADLHDVLRSKGLRKLMRLKGSRVAYINKGQKEKKALTAPEKKIKVQLKTTVERYRDVFLKLGFDLPPVPLPERIRYPMSETVRELAGAREKRWIGVSPFAQHRGKIYPPEMMERVIVRLSEIPGTKVFVFGGGASEQAYAERVAALRENVVSAIGRVRLGEEMELISNLDLMVSMDSSALHMSSLVGVPVVSVWGATHPFAGFYGFGQDPSLAVQLDMACRPCSVYGNKPCLYGTYACMRSSRKYAVGWAWKCRPSATFRIGRAKTGRVRRARRRRDMEGTCPVGFLPVAGEMLLRGMRRSGGRSRDRVRETLSRECARMKLKKRMVLRKIFRAVGIGTALLAAAVALFIAVSWAVEYRPGERETTICCPEGEIVPLPDTLTILSWNIGYAGLGDNMDFFYDGGRRVRDSRERTARNLKEIVETISRVNPDIALLQEVDLDSRRSYRIREVDTLRAAFPGYTLAFAYNYKVCWVPVPLRAPLGRVQAGVVTLSRYAPVSTVRYGYPSAFGFPVRLFNLKRCLLEAEFVTRGGDTVWIGNTHNTAYDTGGMRSDEMRFLGEAFAP